MTPKDHHSLLLDSTDVCSAKMEKKKKKKTKNDSSSNNEDEHSHAIDHVANGSRKNCEGEDDHKKTKDKHHKRKDHSHSTEMDASAQVTDSSHRKKKKKKINDDEAEAEAVETEDVARVKKKKKEASEDVEQVNKKKKKKLTMETNNDVGEAEDAEDVATEKKKKKKERRDETDVNSVAEQVNEDMTDEGIQVNVYGKDSEDHKYRRLESFNDCDLPEEVLRCCSNFKKPSPIQAYAWPFLLHGRDFIGIAATGSGKTIAFGVPALMHILNKANRKTKNLPLCLVLSPTRELAQQIAAVLSDAGSYSNVKCVCLYGGVSKGQQISALKSGMDIIVATPGRLKDLMDDGLCKLSEVSFVVLDEADRMLDLGFEPEVRAILKQTAISRQTVMFSATWPLPVHQLAQEFMDPNPIKVVVGSQQLAANHDVMQIVEVLDDFRRDNRLVSLLEKYHKSRRNRVIVFVLYKKEASRVESMLQRRGWNTVAVHGDKSQNDRTKAVNLFKDGKCPLLIATDVAARGLDIPDVEVVINYSFPLTTEDYVHRIGRTGRAGKKGVAHTFFTQSDKGRAGELVNVLREAGQIVPDELLKFGTHIKKKESKLYGAHFKEIGTDAPKATKITFADSDDD